jgi:hypothetical protein
MWMFRTGSSTGTTGAQGPNGVVDVKKVSSTEVVAAADPDETNTVACPFGTHMLGGGVRNAEEDLDITESGRSARRPRPSAESSRVVLGAPSALPTGGAPSSPVAND